MKPIKNFTGVNRFLSNFYPASVIWAREEYCTVEHAYQAAKCVKPKDAARIRNAPTAPDAKRIGQLVKVKPTWDSLKIKIMRELVRRKFMHHEDLMTRLINTGTVDIIEGNEHGDSFWGVYKGQGANHLGKILMELRDEFSFLAPVLDTPPNFNRFLSIKTVIGHRGNS